jgi:hypothetical protein
VIVSREGDQARTTDIDLLEAMILRLIKRGVNQFWDKDPHERLKSATFKHAKRSRTRISDFQLHAPDHSVQFGEHTPLG